MQVCQPNNNNNNNSNNNTINNNDTSNRINNNSSNNNDDSNDQAGVAWRAEAAMVASPDAKRPRGLSYSMV